MDFDNTIVMYDDIFHRYAVKLGLVSAGIAKDKQKIRDAIRLLPDGESKWIKLQGLVYGLHINEAKPAKSVEKFLNACRKEGAKVFIISLKTRYPVLGPKYDLRKSAKSWLEQRKYPARFGIKRNMIMFESTLHDKLSRVAESGCTHFIDDLPEVLLSPHFPSNVKRIYFSKEKGDIPHGIAWFSDWSDISSAFFGGTLSRIIFRELGETISSVHAFPGSINAGAYKIRTKEGGIYFAKRYNRKKNDKRDRLSTEFNALSFLQKNGIRNIPLPLCKDDAENSGVYSFIEGKKIRNRSVTKKLVLRTADFIIKLISLSKAEGANKLPAASEAYFTINSHIKCVESRLKKLEKVRSKELQAYLRDDFVPFFREVKAFIRSKTQLLGVEADRELGMAERILSPSDMGFHNMLIGKDGRLYFLDLEYFGWDDPAKLISDAFLQPDHPVPVRYRKVFFDRIKKHCGKSLKLRLPILYPVFAVKWCEIILNAFLTPHDTIKRKKQLAKAKKRLNDIRLELKKNTFPLSLTDEANA